jgi:hypothetical protein
MKKRFRSNLSVRAKINQKRNVLIGVSLSLMLTLGFYVFLQMGKNEDAQAFAVTVQKSKAEKTGDWNTGGAWSTGILSSPDSIVVDGHIIDYQNLLVGNNQSLRVAYEDTLVAKQSLSVPNTGSLTVFNRAVLLIEKDYINKNQTSDVVRNGGIMIVLGKLNLTSNNSDIEVQSGGTIYYDKTLNSNDTVRIVGSGAKLDLSKLPNSLYSFYSGIILPVKITDFSLTAEDKGVEVDWIAREEYNVGKYQIERSLDGMEFQTVGDVAALDDAIYAKDYHFLDSNPQAGNNYYRIAVINLDGSVEYSQIASVDCGNKKPKFQLFPSIISGNDINFKGGAFQNKQVKVVVYDLNGRTVLTNDFKADGGEVQTINFSKKLKSGNYYLHVGDGSSIEKEKFIVTN